MCYCLENWYPTKGDADVKKVLSIVLALVMTLGCICTAVTAMPEARAVSFETENAVGNHRACLGGDYAWYLQPHDRHHADAGGGEHWPQNRRYKRTDACGRANTRGYGETACKRPVCAHRAPSRAGAEKDTQKRNGMPVSDQWQPLWRQLLPTTAERQAKEIQRLRRNERAMRNQTRRNDRASQSGDCGRESNTKRGRLVRAALRNWFAVNKE